MNLIGSGNAVKMLDWESWVFWGVQGRNRGNAEG